MSHSTKKIYTQQYIFHCNTEITCPSLDTVLNGEISYDTDRSDNFGLNTTATYLCSAGYALTGNMRRACVDDDHGDTVGVWSGTVPTCECKISV